jgi:hypothetical protein
MNNSETTLQRMQNTLSDTYGKATDSLSSMYNNASSTVAENYDKAADSVSPIANNVYGSVNSFKESVSNTVGEFSSENVGTASAEFLESNSLIARFSFVLIVVIVFIILLRLGIYLVGYFSEPKRNPYIVEGLLPGSNPVHVTQDPQIKDSVTVLRSNNQKTGIEFTWGVWLNITDIKLPPAGISGASATKYQHIFNKGDKGIDSSGNSFHVNGISKVNNGPGMYLQTSSNPTLYIVMDTVSSTQQTVKITNIPLKKWFHVILRMQNNIMDVYVNGVVTQRVTFSSVPKQNYQDVYVCQDNGISTGFSGNLSDLRYYDRALNIFEITGMVSKGPNLSTSKHNSASTNNGSTYLSSMWYTNKM